ncbi:hypothetical protein NIES30_02860 [Phormidium tenue NIES-30]|uniref:Uncharacterized protein n=1 Tax=Phormidium tenue NIES-30 TaxID=549789 RepID=A0A1U7JBH8_9CYAN|nr:hypothetical protein NIES30_02860 [Phormidium tenue NIES-30]
MGPGSVSVTPIFSDGDRPLDGLLPLLVPASNDGETLQNLYPNSLPYPKNWQAFAPKRLKIKLVKRACLTQPVTEEE